jgi:hypothetical protein
MVQEAAGYRGKGCYYLGCFLRLVQGKDPKKIFKGMVNRKSNHLLSLKFLIKTIKNRHLGRRVVIEHTLWLYLGLLVF